MNVVLTANSSWYLYNFRKNTIKKFLGEGVSVVAIVPDSSYRENLEQLGCKVLNVYMSPRGLNPFVDLYTIISYIFLLKACKSKKVFSFTPKANMYAGLACRFLKINFFPNVSGLGVGASVGIVSRIQSIFYKISFSTASYIFFQNERDCTTLKKFIHKFPPYQVLPGSGVDLKNFPFVKRNFLPKINFLFFGRFLFSKGVDVYVESAKKIIGKYGGDVSFSLLGYPVDSSDKGFTKDDLDLLSSLGINFLGSSDDVASFLKDVDCVVLPSTYGEGVPKSLLEAAASGCALIASNIPGCDRIVDTKKNGYLFSPVVSLELEKAIEKYINLSRREKSQFSACSRKKVEDKFDENFVISSYLDVFFGKYN